MRSIQRGMVREDAGYDGPPIDWDSLVPPEDEPDSGPPDWGDLEPPDAPDFADEPPAGFQLPLDSLFAQVPELGRENSAQLEVSIGAAAPETEDTLLYGFTGYANEDGQAEYEVAEEMSAAASTSDRTVITLLPQADLLERAESVGLYDARFLGRNDFDDQGQLTGHTIQCLEIYRDLSGEFSGQILDVSHYQSQERAEADYFRLQGSVGSGSLPVYAVAPVAEGIADSYGLEPAWREITTQDWERYAYHLGLDTSLAGAPSADIPPDNVAIEPLVFAAVGTVERERELLEQQQAVLALRTIGLEPPGDFDLRRDSYLDRASGERLMAGVFQKDAADPARNCQATFIALAPGEHGFQAEAAAFGQVGSFAEALDNWSLVQAALHKNGPERALETMEGIQAQLEREGAEPALSQGAPDEWRDREPDMALVSGPALDL
jgi:hypothetical protein